MAEIQAPDSRRLLDLLFDDDAAGRCLVAPDGTVVRANAEWLRSTGLTLDEALGALVVDLFPETRDVALAVHARARAGHHVEVPRHAQRVKGRESWWEGSVDPVPMDGGVGLLITSREARSRSRGALARGARSPIDLLAGIREISDHAPAAVYVKDALGQYLFANAWLLSLVGRRLDEVVGRTVRDLFPCGLASRLQAYDDRVGAGQEVVTEDALPTPRGERALMFARFPIAFGDGTAGIIGIGVDVTDRKRAEASLRESEERFRVLTEALPQIVCVLAPDGTPEYVNRTWEAFSGRDLQQTRAGWDRLLHPDDLEVARDCVRRALRSSSPQEVELRYRAADGTYRWFLSRLAPVTERGRVIRFVGAAMDIEDRKRSQQALQTSADDTRIRAGELQAVLDAVPAAVFITRDRDARTMEGNRYCTEALRIPADANVSKSGPDAGAVPFRVMRDAAELPPEELPLQTAARTGREVRDCEFELAFEDGTRRHMFGNATPLLGPNGEPAGAVGAFLDITDRERAERALRAEERKYRSLFEASMDAVYLTRPDGTILDANGAACRLHQMTVEEIRKAGRSGLVVNNAAHAAVLAERAATGQARGELVWRRKDGSTFTAEMESVIIDRAAPDPTAFVTGRDITRRKRAEELLRDSAERFATLADNIAQFAWMADEKGSIFWYNQRWFDYTGTALEEMRGWGWRKVLHPEHADRVVEKIRRCFESGEPWEDTFPLRGREGGYRWFLSRAIPIRGAHGRVVRWFGTNTDVTDLRAAEERLREADRRKDEFLGMLSHELRNPLAPIRNALYILDHAAPDGQQARRARDVANRQVAHLSRLVDDLLDVTRIARGKIELRRQGLDLAALAQRTAEDYRSLMQDRGLGLAIDVPRDPVMVSGDPARLTQVLGNLLNNAAKFTPAGGRVTLSLRTEGADAVLHVLDTGPGIAPEMLPRIFEPFTQGKQTLARSEGGLGLGLSLVKGLVGLHGGTVTVSSREGGGSDFAVALPVARPTVADPGAPRDAAAAPSAPNHRVLVIDDNRDAAESLAELVRLLGHDVAVAYDGPSALTVAGEQQPDVVLCDIGLPGMDGYGVARALRVARGAAVRLVALSGYAHPEDVARAIESGFDRHVAKPPDPARIAELLL